jgi:Cullin, a subunit of E3 ubiquitin ligase
MYQDIFEGKFLQATDLLYSAEGQRYMGEVDVPNYLLHVDKRLKEESDRLIHYLDIGTRKPLILCVENQMICKHVTNILTKGFNGLMDANSTDHLSLVYSLFSRVKDGQDKLCEHFGGYVKVTPFFSLNIFKLLSWW